MHFTKMQGLGNDYVYIDFLPEDPSALSIAVSDRHFGIGSDGLILILPSEKADFMMRIFNADGSEAKMCGNGIRCVGKYVYDKGMTAKKTITVDTLSGIRTIQLMTGSDGKVEKATVDMGITAVSAEMQLAGPGITGSPVNVGNPHFVTYTEDVLGVPLETIGPEVEHHTAFPGGVNAEFAQVTGQNRIRMRVWERGSGITMACGTGACATAAAAVARGLCSRDVPITVELDGGELTIVIDAEGRAMMTGPAVISFEGETDLCCR